jgi:8-hydroxy-5-deazaflavin:NADPH oxidoreductase
MKQQQVRKPLPVTENGTGLVEARLVGSRRDAQRFHAAPMMTASQTPPLDGLVIAILGGTGEQGRGLARRFAMAGHPVIIGSRSYDRARAIAQEVGHGICGLANRDAIREANLVIVTVPYEGHSELLVGLAAELAGKIVVDCVNPLGFDQGGAYPLPVSCR